jgi:two-component system NtrC family sensor kinase
MNEGLNLRLAQLELLSRVLGHVTHDVQNHLAVINESAGWMGDLLRLRNKQGFRRIIRFLKGNRGQHFDVEPFFEGLHTIQEHVAQGSTLTQRLSRFAQRLHETEAVFDANKALEEIQDLLFRQATEKGIRLELRLSEEAPMIETDPPAFQLALYDNVEQVMAGLQRGGWLALEAEVRDDRFQVHLTGPCPAKLSSMPPENAGEKDFSQEMLEDLGGQRRSRSSDGKCSITLAFPLAGEET